MISSITYPRLEFARGVIVQMGREAVRQINIIWDKISMARCPHTVTSPFSSPSEVQLCTLV